jgi:hypothetical protein
MLGGQWRGIPSPREETHYFFLVVSGIEPGPPATKYGKPLFLMHSSVPITYWHLLSSQ